MSVDILECIADVTVALPCMFRDYTVTQLLGSGVDSKVYLAHKTTDKKDGKAVKVSIKDDPNWRSTTGWYAQGHCSAERCLARLVHERSILQRLGGAPYIVKAFFDIYPELSNVSFMEAGRITLQDLHHFWGEAAFRDSDLKWIDVATADDKVRSELKEYAPCKQEFSMGQLTRYFAAQILSGIAYCHSKDIIHSDIKGSNVLIMPDTTIRLCDFGLSWDLKAKGDGQQDLERFAGQVWLFGTGQMSYNYTLPLSNLQRLTEANQADPALNSFCIACHNEDIDTLKQHPWLTADDQYPLHIDSDNAFKELLALSQDAFAELPDKVKGFLADRGVEISSVSKLGTASRVG